MKAILFASAGALAIATAAHADDRPQPSSTVDQVVVTARSSIANLATLPTTRASVTSDVIAKTINVVTPEDTLRYLPDVLIRQRHIGDTQSPITTRTSGVGSSARSLIYVDGVLISSLIGNNNTSASPKWGLVSPDAIDRVDVLYGPFAAAYAGKSPSPRECPRPSRPAPRSRARCRPSRNTATTRTTEPDISPATSATASARSPSA
jgi:iron complex outermembrane receptor protein